MSNLQGHPNKKQMATCPFNSAHTFEKDKLVFHITRCKDKAKRMPFMAKCRYNPMHFVDKQQLQLHEQYCQDKTSNQESTNKYQSNFRNAQRSDSYNHSHRRNQDRDHVEDRQERQDRSRSRQRKFQELEQIHDHIGKLKFAQQNDDQNLQTLSDCEECQNIIRKFKHKLMDNKKISKLIKRIQELSGSSFVQ